MASTIGPKSVPPIQLNFSILNFRPAILVIPDLIVDEEIVTSEEGRRLINALKVSQRIGRGIMAPPGVPQDRLNILIGAWNKMRQNTEFQRTLEKATFIKPM